MDDMTIRPTRREVIQGGALVAAGLVVAQNTSAAALTLPAQAPYEVWSTAPGFVLPEVVVHYDANAGIGTDWPAAAGKGYKDPTLEAAFRDAVVYVLQEGIAGMTGQTLTVTNEADLTEATGIVLTTLAGAPADYQNDPAIVAALTDTGGTSFGGETNEAYYIRTESDRVMVIANRLEGLVCAIPDLLETVGYDMLGMGRNWVYLPDYGGGLTIDVQKSGRPAYLQRRMFPSFGQGGGQGTISQDYAATIALPAPGDTYTPPDEYVEKSWRRWAVGRRVRTGSAKVTPGHHWHSYHKEVIDRIRTTTNTEGFINPTTLGPDAARPAADSSNAGHVWINSDPDGEGVYHTYSSDGVVWKEGTGGGKVNLDISVEAVRQIILDDLIDVLNSKFEDNPDDLQGFAPDPEDGHPGRTEESKHPDWYADDRGWSQTNPDGFRTSGQPYALADFYLPIIPAQPDEIWDPGSLSDHVFGFSNWLLGQYDAYVAGLPDEFDDFSDPQNPVYGRKTTTGKDKRDLVRMDALSYFHYDVPPNFNLDQRIRVQIASFATHRGIGKWLFYRTHPDLAAAFKQLLPDSFPSEYLIMSDEGAAPTPRMKFAVLHNTAGSPSGRAKYFRDYYDIGYRAFTVQHDLNFGRIGPIYYMSAKAMWDPTMTDTQIQTAIDDWLVKAFGSAAFDKMKEYYELAWGGTNPVIGPNLWAKCAQVLDEADLLVPDGTPEQERLDDLKSHWYHMYFIDGTSVYDGGTLPDAFREFLWKGQMGYQTALRFAIRGSDAAPGPKFLPQDAAPTYADGPAHYTHSEVQAWWPNVMSQWTFIPVTYYTDEGNVLYNTQTPTSDVDLSDLVTVEEFGDEPAIYTYSGSWHTAVPSPLTLATTDGQEIGFYIFWPDTHPARAVNWGLERYVPGESPNTGQWEAVIDVLTNVTATYEVAIDPPPAEPPFTRHVLEVRTNAPQAGTYRFLLDRCSRGAIMVDLNWNLITPGTGPLKNEGAPGATLGGRLTHDYTGPAGALGDNANDDYYYFYIPKGVETLDFEVSIANGGRKLWFYDHAGTLVRTIDPSNTPSITEAGIHKISLNPGTESGTYVKMFKRPIPYLYSIPMLWAKSPSQLLVPRQIAEADGLTIIEP